MSMSSAEFPPTGPPDSVDRHLAAWSRQRPELDYSPLAVVQRLGRVRRVLEAEIESSFAEYGLNGPDYVALATLRLADRPGGVSQRWLMRELGLTSGTISTRVDRLVNQGLVARTPDETDRRNTLIALTDTGRELLDRVTPAHLDTEDRMLAALTPDERAQLADLLRRLLTSYEGTDPEHPALGLVLEPAHTAIRTRRAVGLPAPPGLLVRSVAPGGPADLAGIRAGDLLIRAAGLPLRSITTLHTALSAHPDALPLHVIRGADHERDVTVRPAPYPAPGNPPADGVHRI
ncbi:MarR family transcriptional regulator [Nocardia sp. alder85J]|uniref:MarR family transcriptional regulator n=1 Tax=Nocardia sp. alder85J TaxID=2862949 RepID=UPI001CD5A639|nr:MarR family transcriptional regulator [Nocardia sp. alder85J]MCX4091468.1 MarR family transcriptional regulator [Nocardia sp. alder85J]